MWKIVGQAWQVRSGEETGVCVRVYRCVLVVWVAKNKTAIDWIA